MRKNVIPNIKIPDHKHVLKLILDVRFKHYYQKCMSAALYAEKIGFKNNTEIYNYIQNILQECLISSESELLSLNVPIQITSLFGNWHIKRIELTEKLINSIVYNDLYTQYDKSCRIFTLIEFSLFLAIIDVIQNTSRLNGTLDPYFKKYNDSLISN
jgi:hypothetical protein